MKTNMILKISRAILFVVMASGTHAQQQGTCGPYTVDRVAMDKALQYEKQNAGVSEKLESNPPVVIRVYFRVCEPDGGLFTDLSDTAIARDFNHLVGAYTADNICFVNCGHDYIQNSALDSFNASNNSPTLFYPYGIQNCITVFYISHLGGNNGSSGGGFSGITFGVPNAWTIVEKDYLGKGILEHEVGHCLGLLHTFDYNYTHVLENINGSNGSTAADLVSDTPADPYAYQNEDANTCFTTSSVGCSAGLPTSYTGTCTDLNGQSNYSPPYTDLMGYWCQGRYPTYTLTSGQYTRINSFLGSAAVLQVTESPNTVTEGPNINNSSGYLMNSAITTLTTSGSVQLSGTSISTFGGQTVLLEPGFHATPSSGGYFLARTSACTPTNPRLVLANNENNSEAAADDKPIDLLAYPNPTSSDVNVIFTLKENETKAVLGIYDINLKLINEINFEGLQSGVQTTHIDLNTLPSGVYYLILKSPSSRLTTKVVLAK